MENKEDLIEDLKDLLIDKISAEYYRINKNGVKHCLGSIEFLLSAIIGAFLIPFIKKLAEKSGEKVWKIIFPDEVEKKPIYYSDSKVNNLNISILQNFRIEQSQDAEAAARKSLLQFLDSYNFPEDKKKEIEYAILQTLHNYQQPKETMINGGRKK